MICHIGGVNGGHYVSLCKTCNNDWKLYNDDNVITYKNSIINDKAYILFYKKKD